MNVSGMVVGTASATVAVAVSPVATVATAASRENVLRLSDIGCLLLRMEL